MKTTIDIPEDELRDAMRFTKSKTKREAVVTVLVDFNRRRRMAELVKYAGTFSDAYPSNAELEAVDERRDRRLGALVCPGSARVVARRHERRGTENASAL